VIENKNTFRN